LRQSRGATEKPLFQFAYTQRSRIHSNSWGGGDAGEYDDQSRQFNQLRIVRIKGLYVSP
jgi:hypothetical protein